MKRIIRLTENDLARIVRRVIKEDDMTSMAGGCFSKTTLSIPPSCNTKTKKSFSGVMGTGDLVGENCLSDIGKMMTYNNLKEVTKVLTCLLSGAIPKNKVKPTPKTPYLSDEEMKKLYNQKEKHPEIFDPKYEKF